jgi:hypothetical protein
VQKIRGAASCRTKSIRGCRHREISLEAQDTDAGDGAKQKHISWAKLLSRIFALDMASYERFFKCKASHSDREILYSKK